MDLRTYLGVPQELSALVEAGSLTGLGMLIQQAGWLVSSRAPASVIPGLAFQACIILSGFPTHGFWRLNSCPPACKASISLTEPAPDP